MAGDCTNAFTGESNARAKRAAARRPSQRSAHTQYASAPCARTDTHTHAHTHTHKPEAGALPRGGTASSIRARAAPISIILSLEPAISGWNRSLDVNVRLARGRGEDVE